MSHTRRIYNNPKIKKAQRYNVDDGKIHLIVGIPLTMRSWICMGRCRMCRDPDREPRLVRKRTKEQFRLDLKSELENGPENGLENELENELDNRTDYIN